MKERYELVDGIFNNKKSIKGLEKQYDKLCEKVHSSEVVQGVSTAVAFVSALGLAGKSDFVSYQGGSAFDDPRAYIVAGVCALGFAVSFFANMAKNQQQGKADEVAEEIGTRLAMNENAMQELKNMEFMDRAEHFHDETPQCTGKDIIETIKANHEMQHGWQEDESNPHEIPQSDDSSQDE